MKSVEEILNQFKELFAIKCAFDDWKDYEDWATQDGEDIENNAFHTILIQQAIPTIQFLQCELDKVKADLDMIQKECDHDWDSQWDPELQKCVTQKCKTCKITRNL